MCVNHYIRLLTELCVKLNYFYWLDERYKVPLYHHSGCKLSEFERVTALKVYNWFANRRKEMKRRANIGEKTIFEFSYP